MASIPGEGGSLRQTRALVPLAPNDRGGGSQAPDLGARGLPHPVLTAVVRPTCSGCAAVQGVARRCELLTEKPQRLPLGTRA